MEKLIYDRPVDDQVFINARRNSWYRFHEILWNIIRCVICSTTIIDKTIYNYLLKLPKIKLLRFVDTDYNIYIVTYNTKFFKHKLLKMWNRRQLYTPINAKTHIIFII